MIDPNSAGVSVCQAGFRVRPRARAALQCDVVPAPDRHRRSPSLSSSGAVDSGASAGPGRAWGRRETSMSAALDANFASGLFLPRLLWNSTGEKLVNYFQILTCLLSKTHCKRSIDSAGVCVCQPGFWVRPRARVALRRGPVATPTAPAPLGLDWVVGGVRLDRPGWSNAGC